MDNIFSTKLYLTLNTWTRFSTGFYNFSLSGLFSCYSCFSGTQSLSFQKLSLIRLSLNWLHWKINIFSFHHHLYMNDLNSTQMSWLHSFIQPSMKYLLNAHKTSNQVSLALNCQVIFDEPLYSNPIFILSISIIYF